MLQYFQKNIFLILTTKKATAKIILRYVALSRKDSFTSLELFFHNVKEFFPKNPIPTARIKMMSLDNEEQDDRGEVLQLK